MTLNCDNCGETFEGRPNRRFCSVRCRRAIELKRRYWDQAMKYASFWELEARRSLTEARAAEHRAQAERIRRRVSAHRP